MDLRVGRAHYAWGILGDESQGNRRGGRILTGLGQILTDSVRYVCLPVRT